MPKLHNITTNEDVEVEKDNNDSLKRRSEEIGVLFGCEDGRCMSCRVEVVEGNDNLTPRTQNEKDLDIEAPHRLMCQCKIKEGLVKIRSQ